MDLNQFDPEKLAEYDLVTVEALNEPPPDLIVDLQDELRVFTVPEKEVAAEDMPPCATSRFKRRRLITHTPLTNEMMTTVLDEIKLQLPSQQECMKAASRNFAFDIDLKSCYHQFALPKVLRMWSFVTGTRRFRLRTIPTGANWCPAFAHLFTEAMATYVVHQFPKGSVLMHTFIDNVRFAGDDLTILKDCVKAFFRLADVLGVDINDSLDEVLAHDPENYVFLGVQYHHDAKTTEISPKMKAKLERISSLHTVDFEHLTLREAMSLYGTLVAASLVSGNCRGKYYYLTKFFRRSVGRPLDFPANIWKCVQPLFHYWANEELRQAPRIWRDLSSNDTRVLLFTDASLEGYGTVAFVNDGTVHVKGAPRWTYNGFH